MDGDKLGQLANTNCCRLSRVSWALAQISCILCDCACARSRTESIL